MGTLHPIRAPESVDVLRPGELSEVEELRYVAISAAHAKVLENLGLSLSKIGAPTTGSVCLSIVAAWKVGSAA